MGVCLVSAADKVVERRRSELDAPMADRNLDPQRLDLFKPYTV